MFLTDKGTKIVDKGLIGTRIRELRQKEGLSQAEFGERMH